MWKPPLIRRQSPSPHIHKNHAPLVHLCTVNMANQEKSWHPQWDRCTSCTPLQHNSPRQVAAEHSQRGCVTWRGISSWYVMRATFGCFLGLALTSPPWKPGCGQNLILGADSAHLITVGTELAESADNSTTLHSACSGRALGPVISQVTPGQSKHRMGPASGTAQHQHRTQLNCCRLS